MLHHKANQSYYLAMFFLPSMVDQRKVKFFSSIIFPSFFFFYKKKKRGGPRNLSLQIISTNFSQYPLMISENTNLRRIIIKLLIF